MKPIKTPKFDLDQVKAEFDNWRKRRVGSEPIPDHLWKAALKLLGHYPISKICQQLRVNHQQLQKHKNTDHRAASWKIKPKSNAKPAFLELNAGDLATAIKAHKNKLALPATQDPVCHIIMERNDGSRLIILLPADVNIIPAICANLMRG